MSSLKVERLIVNDFVEASRKSVDVTGVVKAKDLYESIKEDEKTKEWSDLIRDVGVEETLPLITQYDSDVIYNKEDSSIILKSPVLVLGKDKVEKINSYNPDSEIVVDICLDVSLKYLYSKYFDIKGENKLYHLGYITGLAEEYNHYKFIANKIYNKLAHPIGISKISLIFKNKIFVERTHKVAGETVQAVSDRELINYIISVYKGTGEDEEKTVNNIKEVIEKNNSAGIYKHIESTKD